MFAQGRTVAWLRDRTYAHPRIRMRLREAWGVTREVSHRLNLPAPFEPLEFADLRKLRGDSAAAAGKILILSQRGWSTHVVWETTIGHALRARGREPIFATCGGRLPICDVAPITAAPPMPCHSCRSYAKDGISAAGFDAIEMRHLLNIRSTTQEAHARAMKLRTVAECSAYETDGLPLGAWVRASVAWFLSRGTMPEDGETWPRIAVSSSAAGCWYAASPGCWTTSHRNGSSCSMARSSQSGSLPSWRREGGYLSSGTRRAS